MQYKVVLNVEKPKLQYWGVCSENDDLHILYYLTDESNVLPNLRDLPRPSLNRREAYIRAVIE